MKTQTAFCFGRAAKILGNEVLFGLVLGVLALYLPPAARADDTRAYNHEDTIESSLPNWMRWVPDNKLLSELSLPGTHDTMARYGGVGPEAQSLSLRSQLDAGIRVIDIRCRHIEDVFSIFHGSFFQNAFFGDDVLKVCYEFLQDNPTETILMRVGNAQAPDDKDCTRTYGETFLWYRDQTTYGPVILKGTSSDVYSTMMTLGEVRGKVVIFDQVPDVDVGYYYESKAGDDNNIMDSQNEYGAVLWDKWDWVKDFLRYTDGDATNFTDSDDILHSRPAEQGRFYINWTSSFGANPYTMAGEVNPDALQYLFQRHQDRTTGILWMDFPGAGLIDAVVAHNLQYTTNATLRALSSESFKTIFNNTCYALEDSDYSDYTAQQRASKLGDWLNHILPLRGINYSQGTWIEDIFTVVVSGEQGGDNWGVAASPDGLFKQSDWIDGYSAVAIDAHSLTTKVTTNDMLAYLQSPLAGYLDLTISSYLDTTGDCVGRATAMKALMKEHFPGINWNVAVSKNHDLGFDIQSHAFVMLAQISSDGIYIYTIWAGSDYNVPPVPIAGGPYTIGEGGTLELDSGASYDPDKTMVPTYFWDFDNPPTGQWDFQTTATNVPHVFRDRGTFTVMLGMSDGEFTRTTTTTVTVTNIPPTLSLGTDSVEMFTGDSLVRQCYFTDPGQFNGWTATVNYGDGSPEAVFNFPGNLNLAKKFTLNHAYSTAGDFTVSVSVSDGQGSDQQSFHVHVVTPGQIALHSLTGPGDPVGEGTPVTVDGAFYYPNWNQPVTINWGDGTAAETVTLSNPSLGEYTFTTQHNYADNPPGGGPNYLAILTMPGWTTRSFPITVTNVTPTYNTLTVPSPIQAGQQIAFNFSISEPGANENLVQQVDWGDGASQTWIGFPLSSSSPTHIYAKAGTYLTTMRVTDKDRATTIRTNYITVTDSVPTMFDFFNASGTVPEGGTVEVVGHFQSPNLTNDSFTVDIGWGDGRPPTRTAYSSVGGNTAQFNTSHTYFDNNGLNPWTATVTVTDDSGSVATSNIVVNVTNVAPVLNAVANFSTYAGLTFTNFGQVTDPGSDTFTGTVNYGDGTGTQALGIIGNSYQLIHTYANNGNFTITVNVTDDDGAPSAPRTIQILVGPVRDLLVTTTSDTGPGSLRQAVLDANTPSSNSAAFTNAYADIHFAPALSGQTIALTSGPLVSTLRTRILADDLPGGISISGSHASRVFQVDPPIEVVLDSLTITNGFTADLGAGIYNRGGARLIMNRCVLTGNQTSGQGGGLYNDGTAVLNECTLAGNVCDFGRGGAIANSRGNLTLNQCTLTGNHAGNSGGAIFNGETSENVATLVLNHCTVVGNSSGTTTAIDQSVGAPIVINNSIVAQNTFGDVAGSYTGTGNFIGGDPKLFPLSNYGGPTPTMPPKPGSPAIDAVTTVNLASAIVPVAYWRMGDADVGATSGAATTITSNTYGGILAFYTPVTYSSNVSLTAAAWLGSRLGLQFAGATFGTRPAITSPLGNPTITNNFGLELWVKPGNTTSNQCLAYNGTSTSGWGLYQYGNHFSVVFRGVAVFGSAPATVGVWTHLALVRDNGITTFYVNGIPSFTDASPPYPPTGSFLLGSSLDVSNPDYFAGTLDEIRIFTFPPGEFSPDDLLYQPKDPTGYPLVGSPEEPGLPVQLSFDQRGYPRVSGAGADIGAVEIDQRVVRTKDNDGNGSLRQALTSLVSPGITTFSPVLSGQSILLTSGQILLDKIVKIDAAALPGGVVIDGNHASRIFQVPGSANVTLNSMTLSNGAAPSSFGGAILTSGTLSISNCTLVNNSATGGSGGGIFNSGALTLSSSTLSGNTANTGAGINNSGTLTLNNSTLSKGAATTSGGGISTSSIVNATNSIVADNTAPSGPNISGAGITGSNNLTSGDPRLAPLGNYSGPTQTMPPLAGSPAIDAGLNTASLPATDQRGLARVINGVVDIGSVESGNALPGVDYTKVTTAQDFFSELPDSGITLRTAVAMAPVASTLTFTNTLSGQTILLTNGQITVGKNLTIDASALASRVRIDGNGNGRIFEFASGIATMLDSLTLTNGRADFFESGGAVHVNANASVTLNNVRLLNSSADGGGGLWNEGLVTLSNSTVSGNSAGGGPGGGLWNNGTLTLHNSTVSGNNANGGGGIENSGGLTLNNATVAGNFAVVGGGIESLGSATLRSVTVSGNSASFAGGGINNSGTLNATNSIVAGNSASSNPDVSGSLNGSHNLTAINPLLAVLGNYGGPTQTMPPLPGSPAIDAGGPTSLTTDQRGVARVVGSAVDLGAVEADGSALPGVNYTVVTTTADNLNGLGGISLRLAAANAPASSTITFTNTLAGQTILLTNGWITVGKNFTIDGSALISSVLISGNASNRIFEFASGTTNVLNRLTLTNGSGGSGGAIYVNTNANLTLSNALLVGHFANAGGAIYNWGILALNSTTLSSNAVTIGGAGLWNEGSLTLNQSTLSGNSGGAGGGIYHNAGTVTINRSTLSANTGSSGGGIYNKAPLAINNSTFSSNSATLGGGIENVVGATVTLNNATLSGNSGTLGGGGGGGIDNNGTVNATNSIVAGNTGAEVRGTPLSGANNITFGAPNLAPLGYYGGPTKTMPPLPGSPAIDTGLNTGSLPATDQRGFTRVVNGIVDLGAVEATLTGLNPIVTTTADNGEGSLRQIISFAAPGATITFDPSLAGQNIQLTSGQITVGKNFTIDGSALPSSVRINGNANGRIFEFASATTNVLTTLTLTNGAMVGGSGGAIYVNSSAKLTLDKSTIAGSSAANGGAIYNDFGGSVALQRSTLAGNQATTEAGAIYNQAILSLADTTIAGNAAAANKSIIYNAVGASVLNLTNSIVGGNNGTGIADIENLNILNRYGLNLVRTMREYGAQTGPQHLTLPPQLGPLGNYGGPTPTMPPLSGSPVIDVGTLQSFASDQRGYPRPVGPLDIGAVEGVLDLAFPLTDVHQLGNGAIQFGFSNLSGTKFSVWASTDVALPFAQWINLGPAVESPVGSGQFQFTDPQAMNYSQRFYQVKSP